MATCARWRRCATSSPTASTTGTVASSSAERSATASSRSPRTPMHRRCWPSCFAALRIWREVEQGASWTPPSLAPVPKTEVPRYGLIHVGGDWDDEIQSDLVVTGLRDTGWEMFSESCGPKLRTLRNGRTVMDIEGMGDIDEEAAWTFLDFEADRMLDDRPSFED